MRFLLGLRVIQSFYRTLPPLSPAPLSHEERYEEVWVVRFLGLSDRDGGRVSKFSAENYAVPKNRTPKLLIGATSPKLPLRVLYHFHKHLLRYIHLGVLAPALLSLFLLLQELHLSGDVAAIQVPRHIFAKC